MTVKTSEKRISIKTYAGVNPPKNIPRQVADVHMKTFTGFFLTFLGEGFLAHLYKGYCMHSQSGLLVAVEEDRVVGFLAYSKDLSEFYKYILRKSIVPFAWYSFLAAFRKPSSIIRIFRAFLKPSESKREEKYIELASIGVLPEMKGHNIGSQLVNALKEQFDSEKFEYIKLETDAVNNKATNHFYVSNGFKLANSYETEEGRKMNEYRWNNEE